MTDIAEPTGFKFAIIEKVTGRVKMTGVTMHIEGLFDPDVEEVVMDQAPPNTYRRMGAWVDRGVQPSPMHQFDYVSGQWYDPRNLDDFKAATWTRIKTDRGTVEAGGVEVGGLGRFDSDDRSILKMTGVLATLSLDPRPDWVVEWTRADNSVVPLNREQFAAVAMATLLHGKEVHAIGVNLRAQIAQARTLAELDAIQWPT